MIAQRICDFIDSLFPNRVVLLLRRQLEQERHAAQEKHSILCAAYNQQISLLTAELEREREINAASFERFNLRYAEMQKERDYFRGRAERLELRLLPDPVARDKKINTGEPVRMGGRKSWAQVQRENAENIRRANEETERKKRETSERADAPKPLEVSDGVQG